MAGFSRFLGWAARVNRVARVRRAARGRATRLLVERLEGRSLLALVGYQIHLLPPEGSVSGPALTSVNVGESYDLAVTVQDLRPTPDAFPGVFAGYLDIGYDSAKTRVQVAEVQRIKITGATGASSGTFALNFNGQTTAAITFNTNAATLASSLQTALTNLSGVGAGNVSVMVDVLSSPFVLDQVFERNLIFQVRFAGKFLDQNVANMTVASQSLTGGGNPVVSISYDGDLQNGVNAYAFREAFRSPTSHATFPNGLAAGNLPNLLDDVGAFAEFNPTGTAPRELVRARLVATSTGTITFGPSLTNRELPAHATLLFNPTGAVALADIDLGAPRTLTIGAAAIPIVAVADAATVEAGSGASVIDVLANDTTAPVSGQTKSVVAVTQPASGAVIFTAGNVAYTPAANFSGTDTFTYTARNVTAGAGSAASTATVTVTVNPAAVPAPRVQYQVRIVPVGGALFMPDPQNSQRLIPTPDLDMVRRGQAYDVAVTVQTEPGQRGVFAGYLDIAYDRLLTRVQVAEIHQIHLVGATGGSFTLNFGGQDTQAIAFNSNLDALAATIQERLAAITAIGPGNVEVRRLGGTNAEFEARFAGKFFNQDVPNMTLAAQNLTTLSNPTISVTYEGDLQGGANAFAFKEAFRSRGTQTIVGIPNEKIYYPNGVFAGNAIDRIDDVGAFSTAEGPHPGELTNAEIAAGLVAAPPRELVRARFVSDASGTVAFAPDLANRLSPQFDTLVYDRNGAIPLDRLDPGTAKSLYVCDCPLNAMPDAATVREDSATGVAIDVLANDSVLPVPGGVKELFSAGQAAHGTVTRVANGVVYVPAKDFVGTDTFTYVLRDASPGVPAGPDATATGTVTVTVTPVNDVPSFLVGPNQEANDEGGQHSVPGWAKQIAAGPADEAGQTLAFTVVVDNPGLFAEQPQIDAAGTLTFAPALNASGVAEVTVSLKDSGLREDGGVDESEPRKFAIRVIKLHPMHNAVMPLDTSGDSAITSVDALHCINFINAFGAGPVGEDAAPAQLYLDTNADGQISAADPLMVINHINSFGSTIAEPSDGEGEAAAAIGDEDLSALVALLAADAAENARRRRGR